MQEKLTAWKAGATALVTALTAFLGWKGIAAIAWVVAMALDYISGTAAACKEGKWSSQVAREGLWHKMGMIFAVLVAAIADGVLGVLCRQIPGMGIQWPGMVLPVVLVWYVLTELGSILENALRLGAKVPAWLAKLLQAAKTKLESGEADN
ncbi:MAG: phage holin family protein [Oscillospiraceae bacterium]|nr:phage holin family protein [Oscillospiraceae bacterium]